MEKVFVTLKVKGDDTTKVFELQHALAILQLKNSAWEIQDDNYTFEGNDIKRITSSGVTKESKK
jgi:hypothetical protein